MRGSRKLTTFIAAVGVTGAGFIGASPASASPGAWQFHTTFGGNGMCMAAGSAAGDPVQMWRCDGSASQSWTFHYDYMIGGNFYVWTITNDASGLCLDMDIHDSNQSMTNFDGRNVQVWTCNGWDNQQWEELPNLSGFSGLQSMRSRDTPGVDYMDAKNFGGWSPSMNGDQVLVWSLNGGTTQQWNWT